MWLDDIPVATIRTDQGGSSVGVFYIHTDHLNAPTKVTRPSDNAVIWRWDHDPFGNGAASEDPDGNGAILTMNLRYPGQYADQETGLNYNYFRDYDPVTGRYLEPDPIGLVGGVNSFAYARDPISEIDPFGLMGRAPGRGRGPMPPPTTFCGSGWNEFFVPETFAGRVDFTQACLRHDQCYQCGGTEADRYRCDQQLRADMQRACLQSYVSSRIGQRMIPSCYHRAILYHWAVRRLGKPSFNFRDE